MILLVFDCPDTMEVIVQRSTLESGDLANCTEKMFRARKTEIGFELLDGATGEALEIVCSEGMAKNCCGSQKLLQIARFLAQIFHTALNHRVVKVVSTPRPPRNI